MSHRTYTQCPLCVASLLLLTTSMYIEPNGAGYRPEVEDVPHDFSDDTKVIEDEEDYLPIEDDLEEESEQQ